MNDKINLTNTNGATISTDLICFIESNASGKRYIYHTLNEEMGTDSNKTIKLYVDKIRQNNPNLDTPITDEEWGILRGYMGDAINGVVNPEVKYLPISELTDPFIVSERAIAMPVSYDYVNKQRGIYAESVVKNEISSENVPQNSTSTPAPEAMENVQANEVQTQDVPPIHVENATPVGEPAPIQNMEAPVQAPVESMSSVQQSNMFDNNVAPVQPEQTPAPVAPTPVENVENNMFNNNVVSEPNASIESTTIVSPEPVNQNSEMTSSNAKIEPIDVASIEHKYNEIIEDLKNVMAKEIEAAKRYNATIELSSMHNEQHANYVQNEQIKEAGIVSQGTTESTLVQQPVPPINNTVEPTPITPVIPTPVDGENSDTSNGGLETNWFDVPPAN